MENIDLEEVELIYSEVTYTHKDFSDDFKEFAGFSLEGFNIDNELHDAAAGLNLFLILKSNLIIALKLLINLLSRWYFDQIYTKLGNVMFESFKKLFQ